MLPQIDLPRALLRGRFMPTAAAVEWNGTPIDVASLQQLRRYWAAIQLDLISSIDRDYGVFEGRSFRRERWERWLTAHGIPWPRLESGALDLSDDCFRQMARAYPAVAPLRELRGALSELRLHDLAVGSDARNRTLLSAFRARTGRCQPSNSRYIFGPSVWLRSLIPLPPGYGVAYVDWCQQEYGIAATQSGDEAMIRDYVSGDPYLQFAKEAGAVRPTPRRRATAISANSTSSVRLPSSMACRPKGRRGALASRRSSCAI
jgi:DNA polymerase I